MIKFPLNPSINQTFSSGLKTWMWNGFGWILIDNILETDPIFTQWLLSDPLSSFLKITGGTINGSLNVNGIITGNGAGLYNIPISGITGFQHDRIYSEDYSAIINNYGLTVNTVITGDRFIKANHSTNEFLLSNGDVLPLNNLNMLNDLRYVNTSGDTITGNLIVSGNTLVNNITGGTFVNINGSGDKYMMSNGILAKEYTEIITENIDGINKIFTLSRIFINGTVSVYLNGIKEKYATELDNNKIQFQDAPKNSGFVDLIEVTYLSTE
jgi:hypothetical protein